jgi:uncharacterized membrane protein YfcA
MDIYLPIAGLSINLFELIGLGFMAGVISGMFGVGGGFILTPLLVFIGISPTVAVASQANQLVGASLAGCITYAKRGEVDVKMGFALFGGSMGGSFLGAMLLAILQRTGDAAAFITFLMITLLTVIGGFMLVESARAVFGRPDKETTITLPRLPDWPYVTYFAESRIAVSVLVPVAIGLVVGLLVSLLGVGGSFLLVPIMLYLFGMTSGVVNGTAFFTMLLTTSFSTLMQALLNKTVDPILAGGHAPCCTNTP